MLSFVVNQEKRIDTIFKSLVDSNSMSKEMRKSIKPVGTRPGTNLDRFLVPILDPLTKNEYRVKDSFHFAEEQDP